jgi:hypothetical protein
MPEKMRVGKGSLRRLDRLGHDMLRLDKVGLSAYRWGGGASIDAVDRRTLEVDA